LIADLQLQLNSIACKYVANIWTTWKILLSAQAIIHNIYFRIHIGYV